MADNNNTPAPAPSKGKAKTYAVAPFQNTGDFNPTAHILNGVLYTPGQQVELDAENDAELIKSLQAAKIIEA